MRPFEIEFEGELSNQTKRDIDYLAGRGFDPERELEKQRRQAKEQERKSSLLLPASCLPTLGEIIQSQPGDKTISEMVEEYSRIILSTPPSSNITFDLTDFESIKACEIACKQHTDWMKDNYIRLIITERMRKAILDGIAVQATQSAQA